MSVPDRFIEAIFLGVHRFFFKAVYSEIGYACQTRLASLTTLLKKKKRLS